MIDAVRKCFTGCFTKSPTVVARPLPSEARGPSNIDRVLPPSGHPQNYNADGLVEAARARDRYQSPEHRRLITELFPKGIEGVRYRQGQVGNCWVLAPFTSRCKNNPAAVRDHILPGRDGYVNVTFYKTHGRAVTVEVPADATLENGSSGDRGVQLYEAAYARFITDHWHTNSATDGGSSERSTAHITGHNVDRVTGSLSGRAALDSSEHTRRSAEAFLNDIADHSGGRVVTANTINHAYAVDSVDRQNRTVFLIDPNQADRLKAIGYDDFFAAFNTVTASDPKRPSPGYEVMWM